jgi:hypothetical protein
MSRLIYFSTDLSAGSLLGSTKKKWSDQFVSPREIRDERDWCPVGDWAFPEPGDEVASRLLKGIVDKGFKVPQDVSRLVLEGVQECRLDEDELLDSADQWSGRWIVVRELRASHVRISYTSGGVSVDLVLPGSALSLGVAVWQTAIVRPNEMQPQEAPNGRDVDVIRGSGAADDERTQNGPPETNPTTNNQTPKKSSIHLVRG